MARLPASSSPATFNWVSARSQRPSMARSWNRNTRNFAFDGFLRICSCNSLRAVLGSPPRSQSSIPIPLSHPVIRSAPLRPKTATPAAAAAPSRCRSDLLVLGDVPADSDGRVARAVFLLRRVLDLELGEVQGDVLGQPILAAAAARGHRRDHEVLDGDLEILERVLAGLAHG